MDPSNKSPVDKAQMYMNVTTLAPPPWQFCDFAYFPVEVNLHHPIPANKEYWNAQSQPEQ